MLYEVITSGFTGRQESAVGIAFPAAEFGEATIEILIAGKKP